LSGQKLQRSKIFVGNKGLPHPAAQPEYPEKIKCSMRRNEPDYQKSGNERKIIVQYVGI